MKTLFIAALAVCCCRSYGQFVDPAKAKGPALTPIRDVPILCHATPCQARPYLPMPLVLASVYNTALQVVKRDDFKHLPYTRINDIIAAETGFYQRRLGDGLHVYSAR